mmetsp:Transcript_20670/g.61693  ORF Transcript_20670/g.61693 Transcript_20670/m.61693 type:complete len:213 (-) Transcript_20670:1023-1661(-)
MSFPAATSAASVSAASSSTVRVRISLPLPLLLKLPMSLLLAMPAKDDAHRSSSASALPLMPAVMAVAAAAAAAAAAVAAAATSPSSNAMILSDPPRPWPRRLPLAAGEPLRPPAPPLPPPFWTVSTAPNAPTPNALLCRGFLAAATAVSCAARSSLSAASSGPHSDSLHLSMAPRSVAASAAASASPAWQSCFAPSASMRILIARGTFWYEV